MILMFISLTAHSGRGETGPMTVQQLIKMALAYQGMSEAELARNLGTTPNAFNNKMQRGKFSVEDLKEIAKALGGEYFFGIRFPDGKEI